MTPGREEVQRAVALDHAVQQAAGNGMSPAVATRLTETHERRFDALRRALWGDPSGKAEQVKLIIKQDARPVRAQAPVCLPARLRGFLSKWRLWW